MILNFLVVASPLLYVNHYSDAALSLTAMEDIGDEMDIDDTD